MILQNLLQIYALFFKKNNKFIDFFGKKILICHMQLFYNK